MNVKNIWAKKSLRFKLFSVLSSLCLILVVISVISFYSVNTLLSYSVSSYQASTLYSYIVEAYSNKKSISKELNVALMSKEMGKDLELDDLEMYTEALSDAISSYAGEAVGLGLDSSEMESTAESALADIMSVIDDPDTLDAKKVEKLESELLELSNELDKGVEFTEKIIGQSYNFSHKINRVIWKLGLGLFLFTSFILLVSYWVISRTSKKLIESQSILDTKVDKLSKITEVIDEAFSEVEALSSGQASALQQTSSSLHEIMKMIENNTEGTRSAVNSSKDVENVILEGKASLAESISSINDVKKINEKLSSVSKESGEQFLSIIDAIKEIEEKTKVINDIVFQTKLLSFNASVEAARAGEHGKGFAVVAEEVGNLAQMSGRSASEISELLEKNTNMIQKIIQDNEQVMESSIEDSVNSVNECYEKISSCDATFIRVEESVSSILSKIGDIKVASDEQSKGVEGITDAVSDLTESGNTSKNLTKNAKLQVESLVKSFHVLQEVSDLLKGEVFGKQDKKTEAVEEKSVETKEEGLEAA